MVVIVCIWGVMATPSALPSHYLLTPAATPLPADGNNVVDSGTPSSMFPGKDRVRFVSRVSLLKLSSVSTLCRVTACCLAASNSMLAHDAYDVWCLQSRCCCGGSSSCWRRPQTSVALQAGKQALPVSHHKWGSPDQYMLQVKAVGNGYVEFERPLPYDVRLKWQVQLLRLLGNLC